MTGGAAAFLRFSRDKRGYEHFYLVQPTTNRRGKTRARILYWFRTPPGVRVGRLPFDADVQRTIEAQNPGVTFDWKRLLATPIPPPSQDVERWRERRRVERAEKAARRALRADAEVAPEGEPEPNAADGLDAPEASHVGAGLHARPEDDEFEPGELSAAAADSVPDSEPESATSDEAAGVVGAVRTPQSASAGPVTASSQPSGTRRRRRRGRRRNKGPAGGGSPSSNGEVKL
jgi:hypothetical protein